MSRLDDELKTALQRREVSPAFTERVMARIAELPPPAVPFRQRFRQWFQFPTMRLVAAGLAACLVIGLSIGVPRYLEYQRKVREEGELARAQVMFAFQIASSKLSKAKRKISEVTEHRTEQTEAENHTSEEKPLPARNHGEK